MSLHDDLLTAAAYLEGDGVTMEAAEADRIAGVFRSYATALCQQTASEPVAWVDGAALRFLADSERGPDAYIDTSLSKSNPAGGRTALYTHPALSTSTEASTCPHGVPHRWPCDQCDAAFLPGKPSGDQQEKQHG